MASEMMIAAAVMTFLISVEVISTMGVLRGGGDTKFLYHAGSGAACGNRSPGAG